MDLPFGRRAVTGFDPWSGSIAATTRRIARGCAWVAGLAVTMVACGLFASVWASWLLWVAVPVLAVIAAAVAWFASHGGD